MSPQQRVEAAVTASSLHDGSSYYGRPILKEPVWQPEIPAYFLVGGLAGASSLLSLGARVAGNDRLARATLFVGLAGDAVSPVLLVSDLGRPERFLNMLRVFKVTSPMSVGTWILVGSGAANGVAGLLELAGRLRRTKLAAESVSAALGPALATYTAALLADTAVPVWHEARRELPFVFGGSAAAAAGAVACVVVPPEDAGPARRLAILGTILEGGAMQTMERRLGFVGEPYRTGGAGKLATAAKALATSGALLLGVGGRRRRGLAVLGGSLLLAGETCLRWSVFRAGFQSARDPKYVVEPQRARVGRARRTAS
ncbi:MAG TPA: NrfD/PsrC family molybdoenzyme membrane anchor subunit [Gaiellaceae bacterium]